MTKQIVIGLNPEADALRETLERLGRAFDDQTRELVIACSLMTPDQLTEFRKQAYRAV